MPTPTYTDKTLRNLVISKISQAKFDELKNAGLLNEDELYIVENETLDAMGNVVKNVGTPVQNTDAANKAYVDGKTPPIATSSTAGIVKPDGTTITVDANGVISSSGGGGGGGATGYTFSFPNNLNWTFPGYYPNNAPITLVFADGTHSTLDLSQDTALMGKSYSNVIAIICGKWTRTSDYNLEPISLENIGYISTDQGGAWARGIQVTMNGNKHFIVAVADSSEISSSPSGPWDKGIFTPMSILRLTGDAVVEQALAWTACIFKGTLIRLANGQDKPIEEITYDDDLLVWDFDNGKFSSAKPLWIKSMQVSPFYFRNEFSDGRTLMTVGEPRTGGHRLFNLSKSMFTYSKETVGDEVYSLDGRISHVLCERVDEPCEFYNVITDRHMNLFANGILTSCRFNNLYPIKDMKFVKDKRKLRPTEVYDVPLEYYNGLRLGEQTMDINEVNKYVRNLINIAVERKI